MEKLSASTQFTLVVYQNGKLLVTSLLKDCTSFISIKSCNSRIKTAFTYSNLSQNKNKMYSTQIKLTFCLWIECVTWWIWFHVVLLSSEKLSTNWEQIKCWEDCELHLVKSNCNRIEGNRLIVSDPTPVITFKKISFYNLRRFSNGSNAHKRSWLLLSTKLKLIG